MPAVPVITADDYYTADDEESRGAFSSDIDPATLGPPPEWGTPFMPPLAPAPPAPPEPPAPPPLEASEPGPEPVPEAEAEAEAEAGVEAEAEAAKADELD